jgi:hypothetical protein
MPVRHSPEHRTRSSPEHTRFPHEREQPTRGLLSQSDPEPESSSRRPSTLTVILVIIAVLFLAGIVLMHALGVAGPGLHGR